MLLLLGIYVSGCAATMTALEKKDLSVQTRMSDTIFLEPVPQDRKSVYLDIKNTSDQEIDLSALRSQIESRGYRIESNPDRALMWYQINVLYAGQCDEPALKRWIGAGYGGPLIGTGVGALAGYGFGRSPGRVVGGALGGMLIGGIAEAVAGTLVKDVTYTVITDFQLSIRSDKKVVQREQTSVKQGSGTILQQDIDTESNRKIYRARVASVANKVNLTFEEAKSPLTEKLVRSLAGVL